MKTYADIKHERITAANRAALALLDAYAEAIGEYPTEDDPETRAAYAVSHTENMNLVSTYATASDYDMIDAMVEAIADRARSEERAAVEAVAADMLKEHGNEEDARNAAAYGVFADLHNGAHPDTLSNEDMAQLDRLMMYAADAVARAAHAERQQEATAAARIAAATLLDAYATAESISPADVTPEQSAAAYAVAAVEIIPEADRPAGYTTATADDRATVDAMTERIAQAAADDMPTGEAPIYQRYELETYLGEFVEEYDVNAIEYEATAYDPITGRTVWTASGDDLATICERHELVKEA